MDKVALDLIESRPFQRLRRIKQLGFADHVYPGASHTRFAHSLGVYAATSRILDALVDGDNSRDMLLRLETKEAVLAALLHDIGHGPFSHAFEAVYYKVFRKEKTHEDWARDIVEHAAAYPDGKSLLERLREAGFAGAFDLIRGVRKNWLSAVFASALDADRLDYVRRDRLMSGTGTGAIDFTWLLEHAKLTDAPDNGGKAFAVDRHALQQAETFLMARYQLYDQVYFHKVCRGFECLLAACFIELVRLLALGKWDAAGLCESNHLVQHLLACLRTVGREESAKSRAELIETYLRIDDTVVNAALLQMAYAPGEDAADLRRLAGRIINRERLPCLDLEQLHNVRKAPYQKVKIVARRYVSKTLELKEGRDYFFDEPTLSVYGKGPRERIPPHKKLWIDIGLPEAVEITEESDVIRAQKKARKIGRLFFFDESHQKAAKRHLEGQFPRPSVSTASPKQD